jgi:hypothetical protein
MSLYTVSKVLNALNRDPAAKAQFRSDPAVLTDRFLLTDGERAAILEHDVGMLHVLGSTAGP